MFDNYFDDEMDCIEMKIAFPSVWNHSIKILIEWDFIKRKSTFTLTSVYLVLLLFFPLGCPLFLLLSPLPSFTKQKTKRGRWKSKMVASERRSMPAMEDSIYKSYEQEDRGRNIEIRKKKRERRNLHHWETGAEKICFICFCFLF